MMKTTFYAVLLGVPIAVFADDGAVLASQCFQCHGPNGSSRGGIDSLEGEKDLYGDLLEFKRSSKNGIMERQAKTYTDDELRRIADYFATHTATAGDRHD